MSAGQTGAGMFWRILGAVMLVWLALVVLGWLVKGLLWLLTMVVIAACVYLLYMVATGSGKARNR